ncbi:MAG TPA: cohesin domain-containing protein [Rhodoferax sp.]|nr:cohesin domain-containing protein [Rhodoferax sp.]
MKSVHHFEACAARRPAWPGAHLCQLMLRLLVVAWLAGCATDSGRREGLSLIKDGRYEEGLARLEQVTQADPKDAESRSDYVRQREQVVNRLLNSARSELANERFEATEVIYQRVLAIDPNNQAAKSGQRSALAEQRHLKWLADAQSMAKLGDVVGARSAVGLILLEQPTHVKANQMRYQLEEQWLRENLTGPRLNIKERKPVTLTFRDANLRMVLEAISMAAGLNIVIDKDVRNDIKVSIFVKDTPVEETLDLILLQNQLEKRILGENAVLIYPLTPAKTKEYQELKVRRFALVNADPKQVQAMIKSILKSKDIFVDERSNAVVVRDTVQVIRLAEKLVAAMDQPEPEVMLEVELLDVDRSRAIDLGIDWPTSVSGTINPMTLAALRNSSSADVNMSSLGMSVKAKGTDSDTRTLATPRIRVRNKEKAKIMIGDRTPVVSSAAVPGSGVTTSPVYNTTIQYLETGVKLEVEPTIYIDGSVAIKVNLEVSSLGGEVRVDSSLAYKTKTNNATTTLRLKDGETQVLGGLIQGFDSSGQANKIPGLGDVPVFGRLFGISHDEWSGRELVLVMTPHIIRNNQVSEADLLELWSGTESNVKYLPLDLKVAASAGVLTQKGASPASGAAAARNPSIPFRAPTSQAARPATLASSAVAPLAAEVASATPTLTLSGPIQANPGEKISVAVNVQGGSGLSAVHATLSYDKEALKPISVNEGNLMRRTGIKSNFDARVDEATGSIHADLVTEDGAVASGTGAVAHIEFEVTGKPGRPALIKLSSATAATAGTEAMTLVAPQPLSVNIEPGP